METSIIIIYESPWKLITHYSVPLHSEYIQLE